MYIYIPGLVYSNSGLHMYVLNFFFIHFNHFGAKTKLHASLHTYPNITMPPKKAATFEKITKATSKKKEAVLLLNLLTVTKYTPLVPRYEQHDAVGLPQEYYISKICDFKQLFVPDI